MGVLRRVQGRWRRIITSDGERRSRDLAQRLAALWRIVDDAGTSDAERVQQLLDFSAGALRPSQPFVGLLTHLEEGTVMIDAVALHRGTAKGMTASAELSPGAPFPFDATVHRRLFAGGKAQGWNDLRRSGDDAPQTGSLRWQALIGTTFALGAKTTFLVFGSPEPTGERPFSADDYAFVEVLASIIANRLQQELLRERLRYHIEHDLLTGLPNRVQFRIAVRNAVTSRRACAVALVDLDEFGVVNKLSGQMTGDELLVEIGSELDGVSVFDLVARIAGDHFGILMHDIDGETAATQHANTYLKRFRRPFRTGDRDGTRLISIGASIGLALFPHDGADADDLMRRASFAVEVAKKHGGGQIVFFRQEMEDAFQRQRFARTELLDAIEHDQLELAYQPTFDLASRRATGAEALVRWRHPQRGLLLPAEFVPFAERDELIGALGRWVMVRAIRDLATLAETPRGFCCYINVSPWQLREVDFLEQLRAELDMHPNVAGRLGIEITESGAMEHPEHAIAILQALRELGLRIALDDFGTGYSSLAQLKRLPINVVKLDQSFVCGLPDDPHDTALCETMLSIADRFGFATLAEGIENPAQAAWLRAHGCIYGQGFTFAKPATFAELEERLRETSGSSFP